MRRSLWFGLFGLALVLTPALVVHGVPARPAKKPPKVALSLSQASTRGEGQGFAVTLHGWRDPAVPPSRYVAEYFTPSPGTRWVAVDISVRNTSFIRRSFDSYQARLRTDDGHESVETIPVGGPVPDFAARSRYAAAPGGGLVPEYKVKEGYGSLSVGASEGTRLRPGEERRGWVTFAIPAGAQPATLVYDPAAIEVRRGAAPLAMAASAAAIVFREGLEAVLILASLMGSFKQGPARRLRRPLWWGAVGALAATVLTWVLARGMLAALAGYGELLEALVLLLAVGVLLLITNWFFHRLYWTDRLAGFHARKNRLVGDQSGLWLGLAILGFTSIYREGFETVLFAQALVLQVGAGTVLGGVGLGLAGTLAVGLVVFALQARLPYRRMLVATGVLIGGVLVALVGNTGYVLQEIGWLPEHPLAGLAAPHWLGLWFGLYATWEGLALQAAAAGFVGGSYLLAERLRNGSQVAGRRSQVTGWRFQPRAPRSL